MGQEKQPKSDVTGNDIENLQLESYSKNELIKIIEISLQSYVEGLKQIQVSPKVVSENNIEEVNIVFVKIRTVITYLINLAIIRYEVLM